MKIINKIRSDIMSFPKNFLWGSATAAYQVEGRWKRTIYMGSVFKITWNNI